MRITLAWPLLAAAVAALMPVASSAQDENFSIVINPRTGAAALRNDGETAVNLDGYLLTADQSTFDSVAWSSLEDQSTGSWVEGQANDTVISEVNLFGSLPVAPGGLVDIGDPYSPFVPTAIGEAEPAFSFSYSVDGGGVFPGEVEFEVANNLVLEINPNTGAAALVNQSVFPVSIDSYLLQSATGVLASGTWATLQGNVPGWQAMPGSQTRVGEGNLDGSTLLAANGGSLALGSPINPTLLSDESDVELLFSVAAEGGLSGQPLTGGVLFLQSPPSDADFNDDGFVNGTDLGIWGGAYGGPATPATGDANSDGQASGFDFVAWQRQVADGAPVVAASVPEPAACCFLALGILMQLARRPRYSDCVESYR